MKLEVSGLTGSSGRVLFDCAWSNVTSEESGSTGDAADVTGVATG